MANITTAGFNEQFYSLCQLLNTKCLHFCVVKDPIWQEVGRVARHSVRKSINGQGYEVKKDGFTLEKKKSKKKKSRVKTLK